jgi:tetratricopeptide (TPR) repeat protein
VTTFLTYIWMLPLAAVAVWGLVAAVRYRNWVWIPIQIVLPVFGAFLYFFFHIHRHGESGFALPGEVDKTRIRRVQEDLARLDKAHLHAQLADIYYAQNKLTQALASYERAYERDPKDLDIRARYGACLVRAGRAADALPLLEGVIAEKPRHDHGYTLMALAEAQTAKGDTDRAMATWQKVIAGNSYGRARVQLAELHLAKGDPAAARTLLQQVLDDDKTSPDFHRQREAPWVQKAKKLLKQVPVGN